MMGIPEREEREQGIENPFEEIMTENFPNLVQEAQRVPNKLDPKRPTPGHIIIKMAKLKDKERILKATREKQLLPTWELLLHCRLITQQKHFRPGGSGMKYSGNKKQGPTTKATLPGKAII